MVPVSVRVRRSSALGACEAESLIAGAHVAARCCEPAWHSASSPRHRRARRDQSGRGGDDPAEILAVTAVHLFAFLGDERSGFAPHAHAIAAGALTGCAFRRGDGDAGERPLLARGVDRRSEPALSHPTVVRMAIAWSL